jgi:DNA-binding response OmpR family regulator
MTGQRLLYIEDEPYLARIVKETLALKGYDIMHLKEGSKIIDVINEFRPQLCILDVMLPHIDGFTLGGLIRNSQPKLPIIFLTAKTQPQDVVDGFSSGGTDYIKKPFSMEELIARIENQFRLSSINEELAASSEVVNIGNCQFYPSRYELKTISQRYRLSNREAQVLAVLCKNRNQSIDRKQLLKMVWGDDSFFNSRTLDVYIRKLREYLDGDPSVEIITLKGVGYFFQVT